MEQNLVWHEDVDCYLCNGTGKIKVLGKETPVGEEEDCPCCDGTGKLRIMKR
jgi:hypothetical protein